MYTHQKTKKAKTWSDGTLVFNTATGRAELLDEEGESLDTGFVARAKLLPDALIELDGHLIEIQASENTGTTVAPVVKPTRSVSFEMVHPEAKKPKTVGFGHIPVMVRPPPQQQQQVQQLVPVPPVGGVSGQPVARRSVMDVLKMLAAVPTADDAARVDGGNDNDGCNSDDGGGGMPAVMEAAVYAPRTQQQQPFRALSSGTGARVEPSARAPTSGGVRVQRATPAPLALPFVWGPLRWPSRAQVSAQRFLQVSIPPRFESLRDYCEVCVDTAVLTL